MSRKTAKIVDCKFTGDWESPTGKKYYYHKVTFDNGDEGNHGASRKNPANLTIGTTIDYELIEGGKIKILGIVEQFSKGTKNAGYKKKNTEPADFLGYVFGYAKDLVIAGKTMDDIEELDRMSTAIYQNIAIILKEESTPAEPEPKRDETGNEEPLNIFA